MEQCRHENDGYRQPHPVGCGPERLCRFVRNRAATVPERLTDTPPASRSSERRLCHCPRGDGEDGLRDDASELNCRPGGCTACVPGSNWRERRSSTFPLFFAVPLAAVCARVRCRLAARRPAFVCRMDQVARIAMLPATSRQAVTPSAQIMPRRRSARSCKDAFITRRTRHGPRHARPKSSRPMIPAGALVSWSRL